MGDVTVTAGGVQLAAKLAELAELEQTVAAQRSAISGLQGEVEAERRAAAEAAAEARRLRREKEAAEKAAAEQEKAAQALWADLEAERSAAETAANETMLMIDRLQREKASALMEARQFRQSVEGRAEYDVLLQDQVAELADIVAAYQSRFQALGIDPDADDDALAPETLNQTDRSPPPPAKGNFHSRGSSGESFEFVPTPEDLKLAQSEGSRSESEPVAQARPASEAGSGGVDLRARLEELEKEKQAMRREIQAMRMEKMRLAVLREVARRKVLQMTAERARAAAEKRQVSNGNAKAFSVVAIFKWVFSSLAWRLKVSKPSYTFCLAGTLVGVVLLLDKVAMVMGLTPWKLLAGTRAS